MTKFHSTKTPHCSICNKDGHTKEKCYFRDKVKATSSSISSAPKTNAPKTNAKKIKKKGSTNQIKSLQFVVDNSSLNQTVSDVIDDSLFNEEDHILAAHINEDTVHQSSPLSSSDYEVVEVLDNDSSFHARAFMITHSATNSKDANEATFSVLSTHSYMIDSHSPNSGSMLRSKSTDNKYLFFPSCLMITSHDCSVTESNKTGKMKKCRTDESTHSLSLTSNYLELGSLPANIQGGELSHREWLCRTKSEAGKTQKKREVIPVTPRIREIIPPSVEKLDEEIKRSQKKKKPKATQILTCMNVVHTTQQSINLKLPVLNSFQVWGQPFLLDDSSNKSMGQVKNIVQPYLTSGVMTRQVIIKRDGRLSIWEKGGGLTTCLFVLALQVAPPNN